MAGAVISLNGAACPIKATNMVTQQIDVKHIQKSGIIRNRGGVLKTVHPPVRESSYVPHDEFLRKKHHSPITAFLGGQNAIETL